MEWIILHGMSGLVAITREVSPSIADCEVRYIERQPIDVASAIEQHRRYVDCLTALGVSVITLPALADLPDLVTLPCYTWNRCVLVPKGHLLAKEKPLTLEALARFPIVTYDFSFTGRSQINAAFTAKGLSPNVVLTALDADVIKTYVELGLGVGIVAQMAYDPVRDRQFDKLEAGHLFAPSTTRLALRRGVYARGFVYEFITMFAPQFDRAAIEAALRGDGEQYEL